MKESARQNIASLKPRAVTDQELPFWEGLQRKELLVQKCRDCGHVQSPPSRMCTRCTSGAVEWVSCSGRATLWSKVVFHKSYLAPYPDVPYTVGIVKLEEGPFMTGRIAEEYARSLALDDALRAEFYETADGTVIVGFAPEQEAQA